MKKNILLLVLLTIMIGSCRPDLFELNTTQSSENKIFGLKLSQNYRNIDVYADNAMLLKEDAQACMALDDVTDIEFDMSVKLESGTGIKCYLRSNCTYFPNHPSISLEYGTKGCIVKEGDSIIANVSDNILNIGDRKRIKMHNYASDVMITIDCDTICQFNSNLPNTEYLIIESIGKSQVNISGIIFSCTDDWTDEDYFEE